MKMIYGRNGLGKTLLFFLFMCFLTPLSVFAYGHYLTVYHGSGDGTYNWNTVVNISANSPSSGMVFDQWSGGDTSMYDDIHDPTTHFTMPGYDIEISAIYKSATSTTTTTTTTSTTTTTGTGGGASTTTSTTIPSGQTQRSSIVAVGIVNGQGRVVTVSGVSRKTWAEYALWYDDSDTIYFKSGERFDGKVHSNNQLWFDGNPEFMTNLTSSASTYGGSTNSCIFHAGFKMNYATSTMAEVTFSNMLDNATIVVTGITKVAFSGANMLVANGSWSWTNRTYTLTDDQVFCVANGTGTNYGDIYVSGTNLDARITVVSEQDIYITNNIIYANTNIAAGSTNLSNDALGLIANGDITVATTFPANGKIYAHMMATGNITPGDSTDGSFSVKNYDSRSASGYLNIYGGIVQWFRGAVGTFSGTTLYSGFDKNYVYDTRFSWNPPPCYPAQTSSLTFDVWKDQ